MEIMQKNFTIDTNSPDNEPKYFMMRNNNLCHNIVHPTGIIKTQRKLSDSAKRDFMFDLFKKKKVQKVERLRVKLTVVSKIV